MEYCKIIDGVISYPGELPRQHGNVIGGFNKLSAADLRKYGFYPYAAPAIDEVTQQLGALVFVNETLSVSRIVENKVMDVAAEKVKKNTENDNRLRALLADTDPYIVRAYDPTSEEAIPQWVITKRTLYRAKHQQIETEINALPTAREVLLYEINYQGE